MKNQLDEILKILEDNHLYFYANVSKETLKKYTLELLNNYELNNKYDLYFLASKIIKKALNKNDSHTMITFKNHERVPLKFDVFNKKLYVVETEDNNIIFSELIAINNIDIDAILKSLEETITYSTNGWKDFCLSRDLASISKLKSLKVLNKPQSIEYTFLKNNQIIKKKFACGLLKNNNSSNYTYKINKDIMYIIYNSCEDEKKMNELIQAIKEHNEIKYYIIDLRNNIGGNSNIIKPLINVLRGKYVLTLINKNVYSSGIFAIVDLKIIGSIFIGTEVGSSINCFCNVKQLETKDFIVFTSYRYYYLNDNLINTVTSKKEYDKLDNNYKKNLFFKPDYYVKETLEDLKNNKDVYLNKAMEIIKSLKEI